MIGTWMLSKSPQVKKCRHAPMWKTPQGTPWRPMATQHHRSCIHCHKVIPFGPANDTPHVLLELEAIEWIDPAEPIESAASQLQDMVEALEQVNRFVTKLKAAA